MVQLPLLSLAAEVVRDNLVADLQKSAKFALRGLAGNIHALLVHNLETGIPIRIGGARVRGIGSDRQTKSLVADYKRRLTAHQY